MNETKPRNHPSYSVLATVWRKKISRRFHMAWISSFWCSLETRHWRKEKCHGCAWISLNKHFPEHTALKLTCPWLTEISKKLEHCSNNILKTSPFFWDFPKCSETLVLRRQVEVMSSKACGEGITEHKVVWTWLVLLTKYFCRDVSKPKKITGILMP